MNNIWFAILMTVYYPVRVIQAWLGFPIDMDGYHREFKRAWRFESDI